MEDYKLIQINPPSIIKNDYEAESVLKKIDSFIQTPENFDFSFVENYLSILIMRNNFYIRQNDLKSITNYLFSKFDTQNPNSQLIIDFITFAITKCHVADADIIEIGRSVLRRMEIPDIQNYDSSICELLFQISKVSIDMNEFKALFEYISSSEFIVDAQCKLRALHFIYSKVSMSRLLFRNITVLLQTGIELVMSENITGFEIQFSRFLSQNPASLSLIAMERYIDLFNFYKFNIHGKDLTVLIGFIHCRIDLDLFKKSNSEAYDFYRQLNFVFSSIIDDSFIENNQIDLFNVLELIKFKVVLMGESISDNECRYISDFIITKYDLLTYEDKQNITEIFTYISNIDPLFIDIVKYYVDELISIIEDVLQSQSLYALLFLSNIIDHIKYSPDYNDYEVGMSFIKSSNIPDILNDLHDNMDEDSVEFDLIEMILYSFDEEL